jgi:hypothetical protein
MERIAFKAAFGWKRESDRLSCLHRWIPFYEVKQKSPTIMWSGMIEVNCVFLLFDSRYAHINLPTMRELKMMMMVVCERVVHVERQYTNADGIWQALECFGIHRIAKPIQLWVFLEFVHEGGMPL